MGGGASIGQTTNQDGQTMQQEDDQAGVSLTNLLTNIKVQRPAG